MSPTWDRPRAEAPSYARSMSTERMASLPLFDYGTDSGSKLSEVPPAAIVDDISSSSREQSGDDVMLVVQRVKVYLVENGKRGQPSSCSCPFGLLSSRGGTPGRAASSQATLARRLSEGRGEGGPRRTNPSFRQKVPQDSQRVGNVARRGKPAEICGFWCCARHVGRKVRNENDWCEDVTSRLAAKGGAAKNI
jgi:hypothetical protein